MRKHSTWLWSIIIVVVIFAFVIWGTNPGSQGGGRNAVYGNINGQTINEDDYLRAQREVYLRFWLRRGQWPDSEAERMGLDIPRETFSLLLMIQKLEERKMFAGAEAKAAVAAQLLQGLQSEGITTLADFEKAVLAPRGLSLADLDRLMEHEIAMRQLTAVEGFCGQLVTPQLIESLWTRENQEISAQAVFFSASNYLNSVEVTPEALEAYFTNQVARYRIPDRVQVSYVAYPISNYFAQADERLASLTNLNQQIDAEYLRRGTNYYADVTAEEAKAQIRGELRKQAAAFAARQDAAAFADELWTREPMQPSDMGILAAQKGLTVKVSTPFDRSSTPPELDVNTAFTQAAFQLRDDEPYGGPIQGEDHFYVITLNQRIPSANARFEEVKEKVTGDYRLQQATLKAREMGNAFVAELTNSLTLGTPFTEVATKAGHQPQLLPPFSRSTRELPAVEEHTSLGLFKQAAFGTPVGQASRFNFTSDGGFVVYVGSRLPVDEARMKGELPRYAEFVRRSLEGEAFNSWFSREAQVGLSQTPMNQAAPPQLGSPGG